MAVLLETSLGNITVDLFTDERPTSCKNFLKLCKIKYYNFNLFHSVQRNLVAQTGDPTGSGKGGESIFGVLFGEQARYFEMEANPRLKHRTRGTVSMVNNGNNMHGSQFFITLSDDLDYLDGVHTIFGEVTEGGDVLDKINEAYCDEKHIPYKDIRIWHTIILDDPFDDPRGLEVPDRSPEPTKGQLDTGRIGADEDVDDTKGMTTEEVSEMLQEQEAKANAQILEMVGDIPEADVRPPDSVLFVCKLNPVTTSDDLEMIFSRFGTIISCEVIKDKKSGESLQYAFVEFEKEDDCENAYFKMDNVLIDDRRIHVDFSQSVAKVKWKGKWADYLKSKQGVPAGYAIKDTTKKNDNYDLVFDSEDVVQSDRHSKKRKDKRQKDEDHGHKYKHKHKQEKKAKKKHKKSSSDSDSESSSSDEKSKAKLSDKNKNNHFKDRDQYALKDNDFQGSNQKKNNDFTRSDKGKPRNRYRSRSHSPDRQNDRWKGQRRSRSRSPYDRRDKGKRYDDRSADRRKDKYYYEDSRSEKDDYRNRHRERR